jgi:uncharacterized protein (TIGR02677 family)
LARSVSLQPAIIDAIADGLTDLCDLLASAPVDAPRVATRVAEIESHLLSLVTNVRQFNTQLQRLLRDDGTSNEVFEDVKQRTVTYLQEYINGVDRPARRVAIGIERVTNIGSSTAFDAALTGANLAPVAGANPSVEWLAERAKRWAALCAWFAPTDTAEPLIRSLLGVARQAILQLLRVLERRWETRRRSASVADDFRALARWFNAAVDDDEAHRLFVVAFGLWSARHAHLRAEDAEDVASTMSWMEASPVVIAPTLRTAGPQTNRGRLYPVRDAAMIRASRQREQAELLAAEDDIRASLETRLPIRLSTFAILDPQAFAELLALLSEALSAPLVSDRSRRSLSADGCVELVLTDVGDGRLARIRTKDGTLTSPDFIVHITLVDVFEPMALGEVAGG